MDRIERYFDIAIKSPDGIKKLREMILSLAMQGKLVPQDPNDPPASELLKEIEVEKKKLIKEGKIKKQEPLPPIKPEEVPYALPAGWEWVRLYNYGVWKSGSTPSRSKLSYYGGEIPWVKSGEVKQGRIVETDETITRQALEECSLAINSVGSVLVAMYGANIGEVGVLEVEAATNQAVCACKTYAGIHNIFLYRLIQSLKAQFVSQGAGAAQPNISREKIIYTVAPLPPFTEQKRIVAKVDALMELCDKLETERDARNEKRVAVQKTAQDRLLTASDEAGFDLAWGFIDRNFADLYSVPENVAELKKAILLLAVMGKLVPQDPNDQPASELLKEIETEKKKLIKEGKIKKQDPLPPIKPEEVPYALPSGWEWLRLEELGITQTGTTPPTNHPENFGDFIPFIGPGDIANNIIDYGNKGLSESGMLKGRVIPENSIMMVCIGGSIGKLAINEIDVTCNQQINTITAYPGIEHKFLFLFMQSPSFQGQVINLAGGSATPIINKQKWSLIYTPLPPLAEQKRIVARVDTLMALCDELEQQLKNATDKQTAILNALVAAM